MCFVGSGWQDGTIRRGDGDQGQHRWQKVKKMSACRSFTPARLPLRHGLPLSPYTSRGALSLSFKAPGKEAQAAQRFAASPSAEAPGVVSGRHLKACAFCWAETGKTALLSWHGVCVRWEWASWPGLQCQDPTLVSGPLLPQIPVCSDPLAPVLILQMSMK